MTRQEYEYNKVLPEYEVKDYDLLRVRGKLVEYGNAYFINKRSKLSYSFPKSLTKYVREDEGYHELYVKKWFVKERNLKCLIK